MNPALSVLVLLTAIAAGAQVERIIIPAGSPEDQALQAISNESDAQKHTAMLQDFVQKFSSNPQAVAYGNSQLSQQYLDQGDIQKALEFGEKAVSIQPNNLELLVSASVVAQKLNANQKLVDFAVQGGTAYNGIAKQPRPEGMEAEHFAAKVQQDQDPFRSSYEYLEASGLNALMAEQDAKLRITNIERFTGAFPNSRFQEQVLQTAVYTLGQLKDSARLAGFAEKALAPNPNSISTLVVLAHAFADLAEPANLARAESYARKAIELLKTQTVADARLQMYSCLAHSALGDTLLKQEKLPAAIPEL